MSSSSTSGNKPGPELFIGLVGAIGADLAAVSAALKKALSRVHYKVEAIRLSENLQAVPRDIALKEQPLHERYDSYMTAGDDFRELNASGDAVARLGIAEVLERRAKSHEDAAKTSEPLDRSAFIFHSLKHPDEVQLLRRVYGHGFLLISAYSPRDRRRKDLALRIADSVKEYPTTAAHENLAERLIERDERDRVRKYGQNVRDAFALGDVFVDVSKSSVEIEQDVNRFVEILFGHPFHTPHRDEVGMFFARAAALRSAEMGRQVGAAITSVEGELIAVGANEVPKAGGGQYGAPERDGELDHRDFTKGQDTSDVMKRNNLREVIEVLKELKWLAPAIAQTDAISLLEQAQPAMSQTRIMNAIEFGRAVHAEMAAITEAARRGTAIASTTLYTTTFPCHNCARHIVSAGVSRVVYIEPYAKSLASQFHDDSIAVERSSDGSSCHQLVSFEPFVGIAPHRYMELFSMTVRKGPDGKKYEWDGSAGENPRLRPPSVTYFDLELFATQDLIIQRSSTS